MKIEFKRIKDVNLGNIFPVISEADYKLLAGQTLIIPDAEYDKIQKSGSFNVGPYQISKELIQIKDGEQGSAVQAEIKAEVSKKAVFFDDVVDVMYSSATLNKNVLLWGRGGHNKSEGALDILTQMKDKGIINSDPFVMSFGDGLTEEQLFGGINIKKFKDTGELEYLFKNSFMEHEVVVFEEIFDAPPQVLLSLKDILTSGYCRKGNQTHKSKTKIVIGLTNRSKSDFSEDDSLEALTQRFPLTLKVEWKSYEKRDWEKLFKTVFDSDFNHANKYKLTELTEILAENHRAQSSFCSPRTAVHAASLYCSGGDLKYISDIDPTIVLRYFQENKDREAETADEIMFKTIDQYIKDNKIEGLDMDAQLLDIILNEHKERTGEDIEIEEDGDKEVKIKKLQFADALMNIHNWSKKNVDKSTKKRAEIKEILSTLKKK